ncbi:unnamed protein product [Brassica oleracea var. botrytis]
MGSYSGTSNSLAAYLFPVKTGIYKGTKEPKTPLQPLMHLLGIWKQYW